MDLASVVAPESLVEPQSRFLTDLMGRGVVGTADPYLGDFRRLKAAMPRMELVTIEGASHGNAASRPEFREALLRFLAAHPAAAG